MDVLSNVTEELIINYNVPLSTSARASNVVVTVNYLDGMYSDEYANQLFNDWGVGSAEKTTGCCCLPGENKAWLTVGAGSPEPYRIQVSNMLDDFLPDFDAGNTTRPSLPLCSFCTGLTITGPVVALIDYQKKSRRRFRNTTTKANRITHRLFPWNFVNGISYFW